MRYKISYVNSLMMTIFVRIADNAILYSNENEDFVKCFADGFCQAKNEKYYIE